MSARIGWAVGGIFVVLALAGCGGSEDGGAAEAATSRPPVSQPVSPADLAPADSWRGWGGPRGDFKVAATGLADVWPAEGPPVLWDRPLGAGYSAIVEDAGTLYTIYRDGEDDVVIALDASDGATAWEYRYTAPPDSSQAVQFGTGPNATPLVLDDRLITLGYTGVLNCIDRQTGDVLWTQRLIEDFGGELLDFGYSASPIEHDGHVVVLIGGARYGAAGFDPADGSIVWSGPATSVSYATPIVIDVDGNEQLVYMTADEVVGLDAVTGDRQWSFPVVNQYRNNATTPHFGEGNLLWVATQLDGGTRALHLTREGSATIVHEVWSTEKLSVHYWNTLRLGDYVFASIGSNASVLAGVDVRTGEILWRERGLEKVNFIHAGDRTILFDANGNLAQARLGPEGIDFQSRAKILDGPTWTVPTLVGTKLYIRDLKTIRALDLAGA